VLLRVSVKQECFQSISECGQSSVVCHLSVCDDMSPAKTVELIQMPFGMWTLVGPRNYVLDGGPDTPREGALLREMALGVSACYRALFPVALTLGFPRMLLISIPTGQLQMQSSVTLNFPNEKSPCKVDSRHNFSTTYCRNSLITKPVIFIDKQCLSLTNGCSFHRHFHKTVGC